MQEHAFDDTLLAVATRGGDCNWCWTSFAQVDLPGGPIPAIAQVWRGHKTGVLAALLPEHSGSLDAVGTQPFTVRARNGTSAQWRLTAVRTDKWAGPLAREILISDLRLADITDEHPLHRILYRGIKLPRYTNGLWLKQSQTRSHCYGYIPFKVFGRDMVISEISEDENIDECYVAITMRGSFLGQPELDALELILYLLAGAGGMRQCVESFNGNAEWQGRSFHRLGHAMQSDPRPIFPSELYAAPAFYERVSAMVEKAMQLILQGFPLRAVLFHVFASQQPIPEIAISHLGIALDGTQNALVEKIKGEGKLMKQSLFDKRIEPVVEAARKEFSRPEDEENLELVLRRIVGANDWSLRERWRRFWRDYVKYELTERERAVLEHRNAAVHDAYILRTEYDLALDQDPRIDRRPYEERLRELEIDAKVFRNVMNRTILILLGYEGDFVDFTDWRERLTVSATPQTAGTRQTC